MLVYRFFSIILPLKLVFAAVEVKINNCSECNWQGSEIPLYIRDLANGFQKLCFYLPKAILLHSKSYAFTC